jgi:hypothetical protein
MLGCNTKISLLGSAAQAKAIHCYFMLYITKATNETNEALSFLEHTRRQAKIYRSIYVYSVHSAGSVQAVDFMILFIC